MTLYFELFNSVILMHTLKNYVKAYNVQNKNINNQKQRKMIDTFNLNDDYSKSKKIQNRRKNILQSKRYIFI